MAGRGRMKGGANAAWIEAGLCSSVRARKCGDREEKRHQWSAGRRACRSHGTRHLSEVPLFRSAFRRSAPSFLREKEEKALPQRQTDTRGR